MSASATTGPICSKNGCRTLATVVINHPDHGERVVCTEDAAGFEVIRRV